jgi:hypothetical protein
LRVKLVIVYISMSIQVLVPKKLFLDTNWKIACFSCKTRHFSEIWIKSSASTAASQPLTQVSNTAAKTGLTSGFGMGPGRTLPL